MLIAVDGPSAVGKTTLLRALPPGQVVGEEWEPPGLSRAGQPADPDSDAALRFLVGVSERRWERLLALEAHVGLAYADTDPLKLYYPFATVAVGARPPATFERSFHFTRAAMASRRLGFVAHVLLLTASPETLAARRARDLDETGRRRGNFPVHVQLGPAMEAYYAALERLRPGTVHVLSAEGDVRPAAMTMLARLRPPHYPRYDVAVLDGLKAELDRALAQVERHDR